MLVISWHVCVWSNLDRSIGNLSLIAVLWFSLKSYLFIASCLSLLSNEKVQLRRALETKYNWSYLWKDAFYTCYCQKLLFYFPGAITRWKSDGVFQRLVIMESVTEGQHLPDVVSDTPMMSPTILWNAPVARNLRQVSSCRVGGW